MGDSLRHIVALPIALFVALVVALFGVSNAEAQTKGGPNPTLQFGCGVVKIAEIDPILDPTHPHRHVFFGNEGVNAESTFKSLSQDRRTSCVKSWYTSSMWVPLLWEGGKVLPAQRVNIYFQGVGDQSSLKNIPRGLEWIGNRVDYRCGSGAPTTSVPYGCKDKLFRVRVHFPDCWDQKSTRPESLTYSESWKCPAGTVRLPRVWFTVNYDNQNGIQKPLWVNAGDGEWKGPQFMHGDIFSAPQLKFYEEIKRCVIEAPDFSTLTGCQPQFK